jgi:hypothetical protein
LAIGALRNESSKWYSYSITVIIVRWLFSLSTTQDWRVCKYEKFWLSNSLSYYFRTTELKGLFLVGDESALQKLKMYVFLKFCYIWCHLLTGFIVVSLKALIPRSLELVQSTIIKGTLKVSRFSTRMRYELLKFLH